MAFVLGSVLVQCCLCQAHHLSFSHARFDVVEYILGGDFADAIGFFHALEFVFALDCAHVYDQVVGANQPSFAPGLFERVIHGYRHDRHPRDADALDFLPARSLRDDIFKSGQLHPGEFRFGRFTILQKLHDVRAFGAVFCECQRLWADELYRITLAPDCDTGGLEQWPVV